jgi:DNA-binding NtrC family response regulator
VEIGKTINARGAAIGAQETRAREGFDAYVDPHSSFAQPRAQSLDGGIAATLDDAAAAPARQASPAGAILESWVAADPVSVRLLQDIRDIAATASTVLVRGENGTGKNLLASLLHYLGPHADAPLVNIDCASLPRQLLERELFGSENDGYHGLAQPKIGRLELAGAGTMVLDEVAALTMPMQAKLLRVIDEKRFERVGGMGSVESSARIIALTSVDLEHAVARRTFREDLYYRLNVVPVLVPALRERPGDIRSLAEFFLARLGEVHRKPRLSFAPAAMAALEHYTYPGNVGELRTIVERAIVGGAPPELLPQDLPAHVRSAAPTRKASLEEVERAYIAEVLEFTQGKKTLSAQILGISRKTLLEKRKRYGLG